MEHHRASFFIVTRCTKAKEVGDSSSFRFFISGSCDCLVQADRYEQRNEGDDQQTMKNGSVAGSKEKYGVFGSVSQRKRDHRMLFGCKRADTSEPRNRGRRKRDYFSLIDPRTTISRSSSPKLLVYDEHYSLLGTYERISGRSDGYTNPERFRDVRIPQISPINRRFSFSITGRNLISIRSLGTLIFLRSRELSSPCYRRTAVLTSRKPFRGFFDVSKTFGFKEKKKKKKKKQRNLKVLRTHA